MAEDKWQFWIDRGGTFTDLVAQTPQGEIKVHKLLSENVEQYADAPVQGIKEVMDLEEESEVPIEDIEVIKMGTTVATNALLEREGAQTVLVATEGFRDALRIGYQERPNIFALDIEKPEMLYEEVIEVEERFLAQGEELSSLNEEEYQRLKKELTEAYQSGIESCAVLLMHSYRYTGHEEKIGELAQEIGFTHISLSHQVNPVIKYVSRGDTTVADAYLSPVLKRYIDDFLAALVGDRKNLRPAEYKDKLLFMQSNGGLIGADNFKGKDSILSGPAGGIVGAVEVSKQAGFGKIISFDMGGTSSDVAHYNGDYERDFTTEIAGVRLRTPVLSIHTVAAGGGSVLHFDGSRYRVGPDSAGADPGPVCYRKGGPLTVTDCNVMLGRIQPAYFPSVFGEAGDKSLDKEEVETEFRQLAAEINSGTASEKSPAEVAAGFLEIAVENMAQAIKEISLQRGYDLSDYTLCSFGGAGGQHACQIAQNLGIDRVLIHPYAGVLSAYGMGLADVRAIKQQAVEEELTVQKLKEIARLKDRLSMMGQEELEVDAQDNWRAKGELHLKYQGSDFTLQVGYNSAYGQVKDEFEAQHQQLYGFNYEDKEIMIESLSVEVVNKMEIPQEKVQASSKREEVTPIAVTEVYLQGRWMETPIYQRAELHPGDLISGPAVIIEETGTNVVLADWQVKVTELNHLLLTKTGEVESTLPDIETASAKKADPVLLEIFNNLYRSIAEQMGITLQKTAFSVNIKERLDFSCAVFNGAGELVANAPHIPVHLGSMSQSVKALIDDQGVEINPGDVFASNNPYNGGTHLPDVTVITPLFEGAKEEPLFYLASRGHHADIGGITPGSMPPFSQRIEEEGVLLDNFKVVKNGDLEEEELKDKLISAAYPVRNLKQNLADIKAQIAANEKGIKELNKIIEQYGVRRVTNYMEYVQDNAEKTVKEALTQLSGGQFSCQFDSGEEIRVEIEIDQQAGQAVIDFAGTSEQVEKNINAPVAVTKAAVLYVFRCLVEDNIPLNEGCLKPLEIKIPEGSLLNPTAPAPVVAGNVETSQLIVDALLGALGVMAASQGTMNNFTFGNQEFQYYETICGGSGAGPNFDGTDAVQTHMTNSRLTDPEVLEKRFPVVVEEFKIREGSGGEGQYKGGQGVVRKIRFKEEMKAAVLSNRRQISPFALEGAQTGAAGNNYLIRKDGAREELSGTDQVTVKPGDMIVIETPGGGGYGKVDN